MKISLRACAISLLCASPVAFAGFTVIDDAKKRPAPPSTDQVIAGDASADVLALRAELDRVNAELSEAKARLSDAYKRNERTRELLSEYIDNTTPPMTLGFAFGSASFSPSTRAQECNLLVSALRSETVNVLGFTDSLGSPEINVKIAERRAEAAKGYLVRNGVDGAKIRTEGRAGSYVADNGTEAGRAANRRVEIHFKRDGDVEEVAMAGDTTGAVTPR